MYEPILKKHYRETVAPAMMKSHGYKNRHQIPAIEKVVINTGMDASIDKTAQSDTVQDIANIAGQRPVLTKARKSISNFKLREGMPIGAKVTLRGASMYEFLNRLISVALPPGLSRRFGPPGRQRKLHDRHRGPHDFPRNLGRQRQTRGGDGHYHRHHDAGRRHRPRTAQTFRHAVPAFRRPLPRRRVLHLFNDSE